MTHSVNRDRICIRDLKLECIIGVNPGERAGKQLLILSVEVFTNLSVAGVTDSIDDTIDYSELAKRIAGHVENSSYLLIEKLAEEVARICLEPKQAESVTVSVEKPGALELAGKVGVEIHRSKARSIEEK